jgi:hypothetical protein
MGEGVSTQTRDKICHMVEGDEHVVKVMHILSTYQSPTEVLLMLIVAFKEDGYFGYQRSYRQDSRPGKGRI